MAKKYIDADELLKNMKILHDEWRKNPNGIFPVVIDESIVLHFPVADVEEVRHGKWVKNKDNGYFVCSNCKSTKPYDGISEKDPEKVVYWVCAYCRNCGAKMDLKP